MDKISYFEKKDTIIIQKLLYVAKYHLFLKFNIQENNPHFNIHLLKKWKKQTKKFFFKKIIFRKEHKINKIWLNLEFKKEKRQLRKKYKNL